MDTITKADKFVKQLPELVYPVKMTFDDGSTAEIAGIRFIDWQAVKYMSALLSNPLIVDSANFNPEKVTELAIQQVQSFMKARKKLKIK